MLAEYTLLICLSIIALLAVYPIFAGLKSVLFPKKHNLDKAPIQPISIIMSVYNEENYIQSRIESFISDEEWIEGSEIIVVSCGSTDHTDEMLHEYANNPKIRVIIESQRYSKIWSVNKAVGLARHDILVFSDCRQKIKPGSVRKLIQHFGDPSIGTVNSTLLNGAEKSHFSMRNLLNWVHNCESRSGSSLNIYGALYAQRKSVFRPIPEDILFDDLFVVVSTLVQKKRLITEKNAVIYDLPFETYYRKNRIQRLVRGLLVFLSRHFRLIRQLPVGTMIRFLILKYLKLFLPFLLLLAIPSMSVVAYRNFSSVAWVLVSGIVGVFLVIKPIRRMIWHFIVINLYFLKATIQFLFCGKTYVSWEKLSPVNVKTPKQS